MVSLAFTGSFRKNKFFVQAVVAWNKWESHLSFSDWNFHLGE